MMSWLYSVILKIFFFFYQNMAFISKIFSKRWEYFQHGLSLNFKEKKNQKKQNKKRPKFPSQRYCFIPVLGPDKHREPYQFFKPFPRSCSCCTRRTRCLFRCILVVVLQLLKIIKGYHLIHLKMTIKLSLNAPEICILCPCVMDSPFHSNLLLLRETNFTPAPL